VIRVDDVSGSSTAVVRAASNEFTVQSSLHLV
jgi:hypothetical protein